MKIKDNVTLSALAVAVIWAFFILETIFPWLKSFGIQPRTFHGLWGLVFSPFLHGDLRHIVTNTPPLFILLLLSLSYSRQLTIEALVIVALGGGGLVWLFGGANTNHIGASGIIFGLIGFLLFVGIFRRDTGALVVSILVFFTYGGALFYNFMPREGVSWIGHLSGFLTGVASAKLAGPAGKERGKEDAL